MQQYRSIKTPSRSLRLPVVWAQTGLCERMLLLFLFTDNLSAITDKRLPITHSTSLLSRLFQRQHAARKYLQLHTQDGRETKKAREYKIQIFHRLFAKYGFIYVHNVFSFRVFIGIIQVNLVAQALAI